MKLLSSHWLYLLVAAILITACTNPADTNGTTDDPSSETDPKTEKTDPGDGSDPDKTAGETKGIDLTDEDFDEYDRKNEKALFIFAKRGLNLRESADPKSKVLLVVPYGAKVSVVEHPKSNDLVIDGYSGGMAKVTYNGQTGFMYDGYLSRFPTPEKEMQPKAYVEHIKKAGQMAIYHHERLDDDGYIQNTEGLIVPTNSFSEAFLVAKALFSIPEGINLPPASKKAETIVENPDKDEYAWTDELTVTRDNKGDIKSIVYAFRTEGYGHTMVIEKDDRGMKVAETGIAD